MTTDVELSLDQRVLNSLLESYVRLAVLRDPVSGQVQGYRVGDMNQQALRASGRRRGDAIGRSFCDVFAMDDGCWRRLQQRLEGLEGPRTFDFHFKQLDRRFLISPVHVSADDIILFFVEVTYRKKAEDALRMHEILFNHAQDIILYIDMTGQVISANEKACEAYGYTREQLKQLRIQDLRHPSTLSVFEEQMRVADAGGVVFECVHVRADGSEFPVEVSAKSTETERGQIRIHIIRDITERKEQEAQIAWLARYDGLTGVLNRRSFIEELEEEMHRTSRQGSKFAILLFDIDRFKFVNDNYGHSVGDAVLRHVAARARSVLRQSDHIGRLGGDEFVILQTDVGCPGDVLSLVGRLREVLSEPVNIEERKLHLSVSLGVSLYPTDATNTTDLLHFADEAMYYTKRSGGNGYSLYAPNMSL